MLPVTETTPLDHSETEKTQKASLEGRTVVKLPTNKDEWKPVHYPEYDKALYCTYEQIIDAIAWGKVEAILMCRAGLGHRFIVSFNKPIKFSGYGKGIYTNLTGGGIFHTPFCLGGMYNIDGSTTNNVILSTNLIAFDILCLQVGTLQGYRLLEINEMIPEKRIENLKEEGRRRSYQNAAYTEAEKAQKLLEWIRRSGEVILEKGLHASSSTVRCLECSPEEVIDNYTSDERRIRWKVIMKASKE